MILTRALQGHHLHYHDHHHVCHSLLAAIVLRCVWAQAGLPELQELNRDALRGAVARSATVALFIVIVELKFELTTVTDTVTVTDTGSEEAQGGGR